MRVQMVDPSAYTPPYDHALCAALAGLGVDVELVSSRFAYGAAPAPDGYRRRELFYRRARGAPGSRRRRITKLLAHVPDMVAYRRQAAAADVVHFQWLAMPWLDVHLLPDRPLVLTAHDLLPREARIGQAAAQRRLLARMAGLIVHSEYGRRQLVHELGLPPGQVHVIHHGAFGPARGSPAAPLAPELRRVREPVVLFFGLLRPYKGLDTLLRAWRGVQGAELWIVGRPRMALDPLRALATSSVRFVSRFVAEAELTAFFERADVVVLPYARTERFDQSGVLAQALGFGKATVLSDIGGFSEVAETGAAQLVAPEDPDALRATLSALIEDPAARARLATAAREAARGRYSWPAAARQTLAVYERVIRP